VEITYNYCNKFKVKKKHTFLMYEEHASLFAGQGSKKQSGEEREAEESAWLGVQREH